MTWYNGLSDAEKAEIYEDSCSAYHQSIITESDFRISLGKLHYNATDIEDLVKFYRPPAPENDDGDFGDD